MVMVLAMTWFTVGAILWTTMPVDQTYWAQTFVTTLIIPFGMDMSFPAGTIILSNAVDKKHQGIAASLVTTIVNYSISLGLGFAGTVEVHVNNGGRTSADLLKGYRGAGYLGLGLAGFGLFLSFLFLWKDSRRSRTIE
jgi:MFS family permease